MSNAKRGLRAFGLTLVAAMGLMAFMAAGASAQEKWDLNGVKIASNITASGNLVAGQEGLLLVEALKMVIHCKKFTVEEGSLRTDNTAHAKLKYSECHTFVKGVLAPECHPNILQVSAKIKPVLHNSKVYLLAEPLTAGSNFTVIHFLEDKCALPPSSAVKGTVAFECYTGALVAADCKTSRVKQLIKPVVNQALHGDALLYGLNAAIIHGEAEVFLTGADTGIAFNALI